MINLMENDLLLHRYVSGLKMVSWVFALLQLVVVFTNLLLPTANTTFGQFAYPTIFLVAFLANSAIALASNVQNYKYLLPVSISLIFFLSVAVAIIQQIDNDLEVINQNLGRYMDYQFSAGIMFIIVSVLYLRYLITAFLSLAFAIVILIIVYLNFQISDLFFSFDVNEVLSNGLAINTQWFVLMVSFVLFSAIVSVVASWQFDKLTSQASSVERANQQLGRYFSPEVKAEIEKANLVEMSDQNKQSLVAVLFTDINGFTEMTEKMEPGEVVKLISEYQSKMVAAIFSSGGTVDKFIGDAVMATFGTPTSRGNDAQNAFDCARKMQIAMSQWSKERSEANLPVISHRIGIHFGPCIIGNIGGEQRVEFTVLGDTVNVANRLCDACKNYGAEILLSEDLANRLSEEIRSEIIDNFEIRGRKEKMKVHKLSM